MAKTAPNDPHVRQTLCTFVTTVCISCIRCSLNKNKLKASKCKYQNRIMYKKIKAEKIIPLQKCNSEATGSIILQNCAIGNYF